MIKHRKQVKPGDKVFYISSISNTICFGTVVSPTMAKIKWKTKSLTDDERLVLEKDIKKVTNLYAMWGDNDDGLPRYIELDNYEVFIDTPAARALYMEPNRENN